MDQSLLNLFLIRLRLVFQEYNVSPVGNNKLWLEILANIFLYAGDLTTENVTNIWRVALMALPDMHGDIVGLAQASDKVWDIIQDTGK